MPMKHRISWCLVPTLFFSALGPLARAQEKPPVAAQEAPRAYSMPSWFPLYPSPPIQFRGNRIMTVVFKTTPEVLRELVPEPLVPNPAGVMFFYIGRLNIEDPAGGTFGYLEAGIGVPAVFPKTKTPGYFAVCLYLDKAMPIVGGREIWGWPKKDAEITFTEEGGKINGRVERHGTVLLSLSGTCEKKVEPAPNQPQMPLFMQKIIPSPVKESPPDIWQLVSSPNIDTVTKELWNCNAKLDLGTGPQDPLGNIRILGIVSAQFSVGDFIMDYGQVLHDYLAKE